MSSSSSSRSTANKKLDEKNLKTLRELAALSFNKQCFDCHQRGPTYINMTIGSFVCTSCSGRLRGLNPPHRVKSISMATFTHDEIELIKSRGNEYCRKVWMGRHDKSRTIDETSFKDETQMKDFLILKYEKKRWYVSPSEIPPEELSAQHTGGSTGSAGSGHVGAGATQHANNNSSNNHSSVVANNFSAKTVSSAATAVHQHQHPAAATSAQSPTFSTSTVNKQNNLVSLLDGDPFGNPAPVPVPVASINGSGFANFANFDAFSSPAQQLPANQQHPNNQQRPLDTSSSMSKSATIPVMSAKPVASSGQTATAASPPDSDKYSALKELDELFSQPSTVPSHTSSSTGGTGQQSQVPSWMPQSSVNAGNPFFSTPHQSNQPAAWNLAAQGGLQQQPIANNTTQISANPFFAGQPQHVTGGGMMNAAGSNPFGGGAAAPGAVQQPQHAFSGIPAASPYGAMPLQQQAFMSSQQQQWGAGVNTAMSNPFAATGPPQQQAGWNPFFK